jgi:hypothetical protein
LINEQEFNFHHNVLITNNTSILWKSKRYH